MVESAYEVGLDVLEFVPDVVEVCVAWVVMLDLVDDGQEVVERGDLL